MQNEGAAYSAISTLNVSQNSNLYIGSRNGLLMKLNSKQLRIDTLSKSPILERKELHEHRLSAELLKVGNLRDLTTE